MFIPASQEEQYREANPDTALLTHPDSVRGKAGKLNWFFDQFPEEDCVIFLDDDIEALVRCLYSPGEGGVQSKDPEHITAVLFHTAMLAQGMGAKLFGFAPSARHATMHRVFRPYMVSGFINGTCYGFMRGHGLRFDQRLTAKADYDMSCQAIFKHRYVFRNDRYAWDTSQMFKASGGSTKLRNSTTEQADVALLKRKWGEVVRVAKARGGGRMGVRERAGTDLIQLHFPL